MPPKSKGPKAEAEKIYQAGDDLEKYIHNGVSLARREIYIGDITHAGAIRFHKNIILLESLGDAPITIHFNSEGGEEDPGWAMYDILRRTSSWSVGVAWGSCSSMSTIIFQACDRRLVSPHCSFMIHEGTLTSTGTQHIRNSVSFAEETKRKLELMYEVYSQHTKLSKKELQTLMQKNLGGDLYLSKDQIVKYGFADEVIALNDWPKTLDKKYIPSKVKRKR